jgi:SpoIIAA-like
MSAKFIYDPATQLAELHINGVLQRSDMASFEKEIAPSMDAGERPRVLVLLENFGGWQKGADWNNFDFMFSYGEKIAKIAIVGAGDRQSEVKAFTGAGLRPTPVGFFTTEETQAARDWLME